MQILTPSGYVSPASLANGGEVCAFDENSGRAIINTVENIDFVDYEEWCRWWKMEDEVPSFDWYRINDSYSLFREQSVWRNGTNVCHARDLVVGDTIYDDHDDPVEIISIVKVTDESLLWYRFDISGEHSYIVDGLTVHNASRFWVGGTASWTAANTASWAATSGAAGGQTVPGSSDTATFDGSSGAGTVTVNFGGTITIQSLTMGAYTGSWLNDVNNNNITCSAAGGVSGSGIATRTIRLGTATYNLTATNPTWNFTTTTGLTFTGSSATINFSSGTPAQRQFLGGSLSYGTLTLSANGTNGGIYQITGANTFGTLNLTAPVFIQWPALAINTITNALTAAGNVGSYIFFSVSNVLSTASISLPAGGSLNWAALQAITVRDGTLTAYNSFDLGGNVNGVSGVVTIKPPGISPTYAAGI